MANRRAKGRQEFWVASDQKNLLKSPWSTNLLGVLIVDGSSRPYGSGNIGLFLALRDILLDSLGCTCYNMYIYNINICLHINKLYVSSECMLEWANLHTGSGKCSTKKCQEIMPRQTQKGLPRKRHVVTTPGPKAPPRKIECTELLMTRNDLAVLKTAVSKWFVSHHLRETLPQPSEKITRRRQNMWWHMLGAYGVYPNFIYEHKYRYIPRLYMYI